MIRVNDKEVEWEAGMTISDILKDMEFNHPQKIVSINDHRIPPTDYDTYCIEDLSQIRVLFICHGG